jgi:hypothetical protein
MGTEQKRMGRPSVDFSRTLMGLVRKSADVTARTIEISDFCAKVISDQKPFFPLSAS